MKSPDELSKVISEDVNVNNGLILEDERSRRELLASRMADKIAENIRAFVTNPKNAEQLGALYGDPVGFWTKYGEKYLSKVDQSEADLAVLAKRVPSLLQVPLSRGEGVRATSAPVAGEAAGGASSEDDPISGGFGIVKNPGAYSPFKNPEPKPRLNPNPVPGAEGY